MDDNIERQLKGSDEFDSIISSVEIKTLVDRIVRRTNAPSETSTLVGRYEITSLVGEGAHARVYRAFDPKLQRHVAVKTTKHIWSGNQQVRDLFLREAQIAATISHDGIMPVYDFGECPEHGGFLVMPSIDGQSLDQVLKSKRIPNR